MIPSWTVVVVGDKKTPKNWSVPGVHFLSVDTQLSLGYGIVESMPYKSYTRKNIGYLYAIEHGAEWIYDTDDDNKPYELFNPYLFYGHADMWPRGFPLERIQNHTNELEKLRLCRKMRSAAVQQGLVHKDPDVDAIYRLLHADKKTGLKEEFNPFAPPVVIDPGQRSYSLEESMHLGIREPFSRYFFLQLFSSLLRVTDIWRSYFAQKLLHIIGETISFNPANAVQFRNAHDYLADFESERVSPILQTFEKVHITRKAGHFVYFMASIFI
ncbi:unnamed protein product [Heligmosomoides polygyrus]|uniref:Glycosyl transferase n=1 Tax=Heligmosomoides polygyrus TaxID=6339 RepID=A0A3P8BTF8_HELPZ|nr:unnamed protein product [Heligmosomoides polygyrus]